MSSYFITLFLSVFYTSHWGHFLKKNFEILKIWKKWNLTLWHQKKKKSKKSKNWFFFEISYFFNLNMNSTCFQLSFDVHNIYFPQNFISFIFLAIKFTSLTIFIPPPLAAKLVIRGPCFGYLWTARDQNLHLWSSFTIQVVDQPCFIS